jgi:hypothetical protein
MSHTLSHFVTSQKKLKGANRIIPANSDDEKILTCNLFYEDDYLTVS